MKKKQRDKFGAGREREKRDQGTAEMVLVTARDEQMVEWLRVVRVTDMESIRFALAAFADANKAGNVFGGHSSGSRAWSNGAHRQSAPHPARRVRDLGDTARNREAAAEPSRSDIPSRGRGRISVSALSLQRVDLGAGPEGIELPRPPSRRHRHPR